MNSRWMQINMKITNNMCIFNNTILYKHIVSTPNYGYATDMDYLESRKSFPWQFPVVLLIPSTYLNKSFISLNGFRWNIIHFANSCLNIFVRPSEYISWNSSVSACRTHIARGRYYRWQKCTRKSNNGTDS